MAVVGICPEPRPLFVSPKTNDHGATARTPNAAPKIWTPSLTRGANCCGYYVMVGEKGVKAPITQRKARSRPRSGTAGGGLGSLTRAYGSDAEAPSYFFLNFDTRPPVSIQPRGAAGPGRVAPWGRMSSESVSPLPTPRSSGICTNVKPFGHLGTLMYVIVGVEVSLLFSSRLSFKRRRLRAPL